MNNNPIRPNDCEIPIKLLDLHRSAEIVQDLLKSMGMEIEFVNEEGGYEPMYFKEAMSELAQGNAAARRGWTDTVCIRLSLPTPDTVNEFTPAFIYWDLKIPADKKNLKNYAIFNFTQEDLVADDWYIIEKEGEKEMRNIIHRIMVLPEAGFGNPNQYKLMPVEKKGNHDLFAMNVDSEDENFVLFTRSKKEYAQFGAKLNSADGINIIDFIYDLAAKVYDERDDINLRYTFEIDLGDQELFDDYFKIKIFDMDWLKENAYTLGQIAFLNMLNADRGSKPNPDFKFILKTFSPDDCKQYFFKNCENHNTENCCKRAKFSKTPIIKK